MAPPRSWLDWQRIRDRLLVDEFALVPVMGNAWVNMCRRLNGTHALHWQMDCLLCWQGHSQECQSCLEYMMQSHYNWLSSTPVTCLLRLQRFRVLLTIADSTQFAKYLEIMHFLLLDY